MVGGIVGGIVGLVLVAFLLFYFIRRRNRRRVAPSAEFMYSKKRLSWGRSGTGNMYSAVDEATDTVPSPQPERLFSDFLDEKK